MVTLVNPDSAPAAGEIAFTVGAGTYSKADMRETNRASELVTTTFPRMETFDGLAVVQVMVDESTKSVLRQGTFPIFTTTPS